MALKVPSSNICVFPKVVMIVTKTFEIKMFYKRNPNEFEYVIHMIAPKVSAILQKRWILPIDGVALGRVCAQPRL